MNVEELFQDHAPALERYLTRFTGDAEEAQDLVQETYLRLLRAQPADEGHLRAWLFQVATNLARDQWRQRRHRGVLDRTRESAADAPAPAPPDEEVQREERRLTVRRVLTQVTPKEKTALLMREEGFTHREIARVLGVSRESVGPMVARGLKKLERLLRHLKEAL